MNHKKLEFLIRKILQRPHYARMTILEVGCGPAVHSRMLAEVLIGWRENYTGIDISETAIKSARKHELNVEVADIHTFQSDTKYELFLFLDSLEHIEDLDALAEKIKALAAPEFTVFGNVPLCPSAHAIAEGAEYPMDIEILKVFLLNCGLTRMPLEEVYGIRGQPFLVFEGVNMQ
jgi:trans-aconitate methyltransferase